MSLYYIDTNVIIRLITGDDLQKQEKSANLFKKVKAKECSIYAPDTVIADAVFVLSSRKLYNTPRDQIRDSLTSLISLENFKVENKLRIVRALAVYGSYPIDFGDAFIVATMEANNGKYLYSFDTDFDTFPHILRREP